MTLWGPDGHQLDSVRAMTHEHPANKGKQNAVGGYGREAYPMYEVMSARGTMEVLEFKRMEPVFYITDDPALI
jgi:hypothetical protein